MSTVQPLQGTMGTIRSTGCVLWRVCLFLMLYGVSVVAQPASSASAPAATDNVYVPADLQASPPPPPPSSPPPGIYVPVVAASPAAAVPPAAAPPSSPALAPTPDAGGTINSSSNASANAPSSEPVIESNGHQGGLAIVAVVVPVVLGGITLAILIAGTLRVKHKRQWSKLRHWMFGHEEADSNSGCGATLASMNGPEDNAPAAAASPPPPTAITVVHPASRDAHMITIPEGLSHDGGSSASGHDAAVVARMISSPFATKDHMLPHLASAAPAGLEGAPASLAALPAVTASVAPIIQQQNAAAALTGPQWLTQQHSFSSGPFWDFKRARQCPVRVLIQVNQNVNHPITLLLVASAPPPPAVYDQCQVVLPSDPPRADVDLSIDPLRDLSFPANSFIGQGAFAQVHRALYRGMHPVAIKMLTDPSLRSMCSASRESLSALEGELRIMARLQHPNIVRCYGGNLEGSNPFIVEELCECNLDKIIQYYREAQGTGLPLKATLHFGLNVASALWFLHPSIVHRDLKPQNVLLDWQGVAKVADFGLSRMKTHSALTTRHSGAGTALYMAPECFSGEGITEKVDVYALGMLLWELVTGERPWKGLNLVQVAFQVAVAVNRPALPSADPARCPAALLQLISNCWAQNPKERPSSGEVMKALGQLIRVNVPNTSFTHQ